MDVTLSAVIESRSRLLPLAVLLMSEYLAEKEEEETGDLPLLLLLLGRGWEVLAGYGRMARGFGRAGVGTAAATPRESADGEGGAAAGLGVLLILSYATS